MNRLSGGISSGTRLPLGLGSRVRLCFPKSSDQAALLKLNRASRRFYGGHVAPPTKPGQYSRYLVRCGRPNFIGLLVRRRFDNAIVGAVELSQIVLGGFRSAYLGYYIGAPFARRGLMSDALELVMRYAFTRIGLHRLEANIQPANRASVALVAKLGFSQEGYSRRYLKIAGRWRDHERWAILSEDWLARRRKSRKQQEQP